MAGERIDAQNDVRFLALEPGDLHPAAAVAQCVDGQWVPRTLLGRMLARGESLADVAGERLALVRAEYLRALINAPQLVVHRAALLGNPALARDLLSDSGEREALGRLLDAGAVVPFLLTETSPADAPRQSPADRGFAAWLRLCQKVRLRCLRLDWADDQGSAAAHQSLLRRRFGWFASGVHQLDALALGRCLGLRVEDRPAFEQRLTQVALWCAGWAGQGRTITRDELYRQFVVAEGSRPAEGRYDRGKPFACEVKQLLDLHHNANVPDALSRYPLVPADSLQRSALQEWRQLAAGPATISLRELAARIRQAASQPVQDSACVGSLGVLSLSEVEMVRRTEAWAAFAESLQHLIARPLDFADTKSGAVAVYDRYVRLAQVVTSFAKRRNPGLRTERWAPVAEFVVEVAGAALSIIPGLLGQDAVACRAAGGVSVQAAARTVPFGVRLVVRGLPERGSRADLHCGVHLFQGRLDDAGEQWRELLAGFGLTASSAVPGQLPAERTAAMECPGSDLP